MAGLGEMLKANIYYHCQSTFSVIPKTQKSGNVMLPSDLLVTETRKILKGQKTSCKKCSI